MRRSEQRALQTTPPDPGSPDLEIRRSPPPSRVPEVFGAGGTLQRAFPGYEPRPQQALMAAAVERAVDLSEHLVVEAPCGVGKGLSYLAPAILRCAPLGKRVLVVTANIALQEQLIGKDLPMLRELLPVSFTFAIAKGRANFLCDEQLQETQREVGRRGALKVLGAQAHRWNELEAWAMRTRSGDLSELPFEVGPLRTRVAVTSDECAGPTCPTRKECHAERAKEAFWNASVVVTNYAMFFLDMQLRAASEGESCCLPAWDVLVCDEVHRMPDICREFWGGRASEGAVKHAARLLDRGDDPVAPELADDLKAEAASYFGELLRHRKGKAYRVRLRSPGEGADPSRLVELLSDGCAALSRAATLEENPARRQRIRGSGRRMSEIAVLLTQASSMWEPERRVYCVELEGQGDRAALVSKLVWPADVLRPLLFAPAGRSVVMCSATVCTGEGKGGFDFVRGELGCDAGRTKVLAVGSPFDFERQALLVCPRSAVGAKDRDEHEAEVARRVVQVAHASRGRLLAVFTSTRGLKAAKALFEEVPHADRTWTELLAQGDAPRSELVARFKSGLRFQGADLTSHGAVLLGLDSFREGVDVPGEALSVVVVDRLPFSPPDDPILDAVDQATPGGAFMAWSLPRAITALRQAAGRGIRRADDRAVVVVLDDRLTTKGYGRKFLRALPPMPLSRDLSDVAPFLDGIVGSRDPTIPGEGPSMSDLWKRDPKTLEERAVLDLSAAMSNAAGDSAVSILHQDEAARFVRERGWAAAVERAAEIALPPVAEAK